MAGRAASAKFPISPFEGEMPGKAEGEKTGAAPETCSPAAIKPPTPFPFGAALASVAPEESKGIPCP